MPTVGMEGEMMEGRSESAKGAFYSFAELLEASFPERRMATAGEIVYDGASSREKVCFYLCRGIVEGTLIHENGGDTALFRRGAGSIFPLYYSDDKLNMGAVLSFTAVSDVELVVMAKPRFRQLMLDNAELAVAMVEAYGQFSARLDYTLMSRLYDSLFTRVCDYLFSHANNGVLSCTQSHIASSTGGSRPKVAAVLGQLRDMGILETGRRQIRILDPARLRDLCSYVVRTG